MYQKQYIPILESSAILKVRSMLINLSLLRFFLFWRFVKSNAWHLLLKVNISSVTMFTKYSYCKPSSKCGKPTSARLEGHRVVIG